MLEVFAEDVRNRPKLYKVNRISDPKQQRRTKKKIEIAGCQKAIMI